MLANASDIFLRIFFLDAWKSVALSHTGKIRKINEDSFICRDDNGFWAVADGMGGHAAGDYASQQIIMRFSQMQFTGKDLHEVADYLDDNLDEIDKKLKNYAEEHQASAVGSTVVSLLLGENNIGMAYWVGDSRAYQLRDGRLRCLTRDHSLVQELVDVGELTEAQAVNYPSKNIITRAIGANNSVFSEVSLFDYQKDDIYLLCSDGLNNELSDQEIFCVLDDDDLTLKEKAKVIMAGTLQKVAADNITFVLVEVCR